ncbi:Membrane protein CcdC involved in cytochrome C biogenesis [Paenibacillus sp. UNC496MF]|uniref:CcdC protein domain-containing protein n=1 Tax=Paenibacillus sp. UNC496MF TaxID=1502753 RepID=UPI0008DFFA4F|nr:CcdC protein domain-containing protein [Paenibacillus sp. UNC496MF]SFJ85725.1 Membrane protein CcdC involved in cytochrome C biogenesis [Paenibacillus sp. UNC496MF]
MDASTFIGYGIAAVVIVLVIWLRSRGKRRPVRNNGIGMLMPVFVLLAAFGFGINALTQIPDHPFHMPAAWELLCALLVGCGLGSIMLYHTGYEKLADGLVYAKPNKNFKYVLIAIVVIRIALSEYFKGLDYTEFTLLTMVLAFAYVSVWRIGSFVKFRQARLTAAE